MESLLTSMGCSCRIRFCWSFVQDLARSAMLTLYADDAQPCHAYFSVVLKALPTGNYRARNCRQDRFCRAFFPLVSRPYQREKLQNYAMPEPLLFRDHHKGRNHLSKDFHIVESWPARKDRSVTHTTHAWYFFAPVSLSVNIYMSACSRSIINLL